MNKGCKKSFADLSEEELLELRAVTLEIESVLSGEFAYDNINYLALMMIDPLLHYHIIPRYKKNIFLGKVEFSDFSYPNPPDLTLFNQANDEEMKIIIKRIKKWL
ncbi:hypothetical protein N9270_05420 [Akkermansiaceae bacterium]|nr:hypothetical protein [Akkermansiaceae bacterium]